jgi:hypothetical protein
MLGIDGKAIAARRRRDVANTPNLLEEAAA